MWRSHGLHVDGADDVSGRALDKHGHVAAGARSHTATLHTLERTPETHHFLWKNKIEKRMHCGLEEIWFWYVNLLCCCCRWCAWWTRDLVRTSSASSTTTLQTNTNMAFNFGSLRYQSCKKFTFLDEEDLLAHRVEHAVAVLSVEVG